MLPSKLKRTSREGIQRHLEVQTGKISAPYRQAKEGQSQCGSLYSVTVDLHISDFVSVCVLQVLEVSFLLYKVVHFPLATA